jgi:uncharacterized membrane protein YcaP (DUF421 family)
MMKMLATPVDMIVRSFLFIAILFLITKLVGKKQISQISFFEYVSGITIGSIAAEVITELEANMFYGFMSILIFGLTTLFVDFTSLKSKKFRDFVEGKGAVVIKNGKIQEEQLKKERYSIDELSALLRKQNVFRVADVEFAVLEPSGDLSVLLKKENRPLTPKDIGLLVTNEKEPQTIIMDGKILNDPLAATGKNRAWLYLELEKLGLTLENVFFAQVDSFGELTVDLYDDNIQVPTPQEHPPLIAQLRKCKADLESEATETQSEELKKIYQHNSNLLSQAIENLKPHLKC